MNIGTNINYSKCLFLDLHMPKKSTQSALPAKKVAKKGHITNLLSLGHRLYTADHSVI